MNEWRQFKKPGFGNLVEQAVSQEIWRYVSSYLWTSVWNQIEIHIKRPIYSVRR